MAQSVYADHSYFIITKVSGKDFCVYLSDPTLAKTYEVIGRAQTTPQGTNTVISAYIQKHLTPSGILPTVITHSN